MRARVAITPRSISEGGHPALQRIADEGYELVFPAPGRQPTELELIRALPGCVGYLAGVEPVSRAVLEACRGLKVISRNGVGVDNIDLDAARAMGVVVERAVSANTRGVAELALTFMLCGLRHVAWSHAQLKTGAWSRRKGSEAFGRTLGVVGFGAIGQTIGSLAAALGMKVVAFDPYVDPARFAGVVEIISLDELMLRADVITLHAPPRAEPLIDAAALARMRRGVVLVNTARAELIDDDALLSALDSGQVGAFATDVFRTEPPAMTPLLRHENVILSPHAGGFTEESVDRATRIAVDNLLRTLGRHD